MTKNDLEKWLEENDHIEWADNMDEKRLLFRNTRLDWYKNDEKRATAIDYSKVEDMTTDGLLKEINRGLEVEGITRITGYFTKTGSWNGGKLAELRDRKRGWM